MKKLHTSDWLKISAFFMQNGCKVATKVQSCDISAYNK